jgi:energy-coupling factor transporter ATP-binding protein EcfA2
MVRVTIKDFQAIGRATLTAEGLTVITGPSDRGKSALLRAIEAGLFNRTGEGFVRVGQASASVHLVLAHSETHEILWEKGGGANRFTVDGTAYGRVGRDAPPILKQLGFRDELIGARITDDGVRQGGEIMRPQVARQFDPIFLLGQSGSFINETMVKLSRLGVLQRANRLCSSDLRTAKHDLGRQAEIALAARAAADQLHPVVDLRTRVEQLVARLAAVAAARARLTALGALVAQRQQVWPWASAALPDSTRASLTRVVQRGLGAATLRALLTQQAATRPLVVDLPAATRPDKRWWKRGETLRALTPLSADRARTLARVGVLPPPRAVAKPVVTRVRLYQSLAPVVAIRAGAARALGAQADGLGEWQLELHDAEAAVAAFKQQVRVCPVCDKPFD